MMPSGSLMPNAPIRSASYALCMTLAAVVPFATVMAQKPAAVAEVPMKTTRELKFTTDEGTWRDLDVSPDGRTIVFEMLGDLYTLPIAGGKATRITEGPPFDW